MLDDALAGCIDVALARLTDRCRSAPALGAALESWTARLSPTGRAADYFEGGREVMFVLPWWLEKRIRTAPDVAFQQQLVESTVSAYYFVRLIDDVMDGEPGANRALLPLLAVLHTSLHGAYSRIFPANAAFWEHFDKYWTATAEAAAREKTLASVSAADFRDVSARKTSGIKIPIAAVCCRYERLELLEPWLAFCDALACWQQMVNDTFDWARDFRSGNMTFFLSEAVREKRAGESVSGWAVRRGFTWAFTWLDTAMRDARLKSEQLDSPEVVRFLDYREAEVRQRRLEIESNLEAVVTLADVFEPGVKAQQSQ